MGTKPRRWFPGAAYHITARGNRKEDIFRDDEDFQVYLSIKKHALEYYNGMYDIICYCLMTNHVHILVKTKELHIGRLIGRVNGIYAKWFNDKYNYVGHLFQDRYYAELIENDAQMLTASQYIHLNPVRANMVAIPEQYRWSSYQMYIGRKKVDLIETAEVLSHFHGSNKLLYKQFVERGITPGVRD
jgi:REP element-mobilizing transposase RayT